MTGSGDLDHCGVGIRGVAVAIDSFVWFVLLFVAVFPVAAVTGDVSTSGGTTNADLSGTPAVVALALWLALGVGYHALLEWRYGRTVGKYLVKIRATSADGSSLSLREAVVRNALRLVDWLPLCYAVGIAAVLTSGRAQRLGDRVADTVVVRD
ncbi:RDD family protein [Halobacterium wangiae]|uniref:RDD family protein n=1 Tax=Halobacterium wangiae TaxID=2902623 RepID=UPI001E37AA46|nr:RDD family protein [Halobacterium wangiae]